MLGLFPAACAADVENPYGDGSLRLQIALASHVAITHPENVPARQDGCEICDDYERRADAVPAWLWAEHRARALFLPASIASAL
ncbi:hypothetical protein [Streptomyces sp. NPDC047070]|uniref:hypothetical protein n=1 Tax=Streptomyces sp. NPDC047070 TaxID=3154923 RepID=UPI003456E652